VTLCHGSYPACFSATRAKWKFWPLGSYIETVDSIFPRQGDEAAMVKDHTWRHTLNCLLWISVNMICFQVAKLVIDVRNQTV
jgi:hypothetical protein